MVLLLRHRGSRWWWELNPSFHILLFSPPSPKVFSNVSHFQASLSQALLQLLGNAGLRAHAYPEFSVMPWVGSDPCCAFKLSPTLASNTSPAADCSGLTVKMHVHGHQDGWPVVTPRPSKGDSLEPQLRHKVSSSTSEAKKKETQVIQSCQKVSSIIGTEHAVAVINYLWADLGKRRRQVASSSEMRTGRFTDARLTGSLGGTHLALQEKWYNRLLSIAALASALEA